MDIDNEGFSIPLKFRDFINKQTLSLEQKFVYFTLLKVDNLSYSANYSLKCFSTAIIFLFFNASPHPQLSVPLMYLVNKTKQTKLHREKVEKTHRYLNLVKKSWSSNQH